MRAIVGFRNVILAFVPAMGQAVASTPLAKLDCGARTHVGCFFIFLNRSPVRKQGQNWAFDRRWSTGLRWRAGVARSERVFLRNGRSCVGGHHEEANSGLFLLRSWFDQRILQPVFAWSDCNRLTGLCWSIGMIVIKQQHLPSKICKEMRKKAFLASKTKLPWPQSA